ncbi:uncharacterized protein Dwil_GK17948 [Drosophila willistoni]|uniref:Uncharacterized protein n=1 Tax=Drosophila willistoni TaxID=7260 RepID=B4N5V7_DROWI|nr:uncharacterized protein Dwil_GK17948 [Drosophila willistoni]
MFSVPLFIPLTAFRKVDKNETLGPKAGKYATYKNPEIFAYHRYSYYDLKKAANDVKLCTMESKLNKKENN